MTDLVSLLFIGIILIDFKITNFFYTCTFYIYEEKEANRSIVQLWFIVKLPFSQLSGVMIIL